MSFVMLTDSQLVPAQSITNNYENPNKTPKSSSKKGSSTKGAPNGDATEDPPKKSFSQQIESSTRLFEILSARSDIDHPVCTECTELLLTQLQSRLTSAQKDRDAYISFLKSLHTNQPTPSAVSSAQKALSAAQSEQQKAFSTLLNLEREKASLDSEIADLEAESLALDKEEEDFWRSRNAFSEKLVEFQEERDALNAAYDHDAQLLERLQRTNVYNDCFCISHDGHFGTINGLRLGRLAPPQNVDWSEINAAMGTAALLLATVAEKLDFQFQGYRIKPMGSNSRIEKLEYPSSPSQSSTTSSTTTTTTTATTNTTTPIQSQQPPKTIPLDLFSSGDLPLGNRFLHRRLDAGMVAFLELIRQLGDFVEASLTPTVPAPSTAYHKLPSPTSPNRGGGAGAGGGIVVKLPYPIKRDKIGDASIKLGGNSDEVWTRACKYALTCCKFLLAHASNVGGASGRGGGGGGVGG